MPVSLVQFAWMQVEKYPFCGFTSSDILFPNCDETYDDTFSLFPYLPFSKSTLRPVPAPCENFYQLSSKKIGGNHRKSCAGGKSHRSAPYLAARSARKVKDVVEMGMRGQGRRRRREGWVKAAVLRRLEALLDTTCQGSPAAAKLKSV